MQRTNEFRPINIPVYGVPARKYNCYVRYTGKSYYDTEHVKMPKSTRPVNILGVDDRLTRTVARIPYGFLP